MVERPAREISPTLNALASKILPDLWEKIKKERSIILQNNLVTHNNKVVGQGAIHVRNADNEKFKIIFDGISEDESLRTLQISDVINPEGIKRTLIFKGTVLENAFKTNIPGTKQKKFSIEEKVMFLKTIEDIQIDAVSPNKISTTKSKT
jgi:hypothetical protein